ncbi:dsDNA-mimic protein [Salmonella enterica subsp. enterica]|uniref:DsDNA-mimic protein n=1 Tax=Salmonella enterica I TaxID=59201 RepID=A0A3S4J4X9_SALET|nr:dsDNA-mimic protein [Salmonella enterica subsp. enterica]
MEMDLNNRLTEDETLEQAYDIFLELAADNLIRLISFCSICNSRSAVARSCLIPLKTGKSTSILT